MQWEAVPPGNRPYRVVLDAERPAGVFRLSTHTHTQWTFMSDTVASDNFEPFAVMKLDYRLATDLEGDVRAGRRSTSRSAPRRRPPSPAGKLTHVTLGVSSNGGKVVARGAADQGRRTAGGTAPSRRRTSRAATSRCGRTPR